MKWRILIVDDEEDVRTILKATLSDQYEVVEAHDGLDALEKLARYEPDFVILDIMMPMMDGFEACEAIRKDKKFKDVPVLFLTALAGREHIKRGYNTGANLYLTKPFEPTRLLKNIDVHFDTARATVRNKRYTIEQIQKLEAAGAEPVAPGSGEFDVRNVPGVTASRGVTGAGTGKPRVMVVDDDPDIIGFVEASIGDWSEVCSASDGFQAIERLVRYQPDVLMIDIMLPKLSGFQLCQSLRGNNAFKKLPVVVCSAKCSERDVQFAQRVGANDFLPKPFTSAQLNGKVRQFTHVPGFQAKPKNLSLEEIQRQNNPETTDVFEVEESGVRKMRLDNTPLKDFLHEQKKQDAAQAKEEEDKQKSGRGIFRFGKK